MTKPYQRPQRLKLSAAVVHGDLRYASHPIVVGHYEGDTIVGAEAQIDALLEGALSQRYTLDLYPGEPGSLALVLRRATDVQSLLNLPSAAIVVGLGKWGELTSSQLADLLRRATLQYVLALADDREVSAATSPIPTAPVGLSVLLIGGNSATNIDVGDSVGAILRGIAHANRELADDHVTDLRIDEVEIIELYADRAIEAAHACKRLAPLIEKEFDTDIEVAKLLQHGREGRARLTAAINCDAWRRWEISVVDQRQAPGPAEGPEVYREIRFLTLSDRARAEATSQQRQPELLERLIRESISNYEYRPHESRVLFELAIPNELKSGLARIDNLVLVVDAESAEIPWELMSDGDAPLCLAKALVRQLQTSRFRPQISTRAGKSAYIVGDPRVTPPLKQLNGARNEAQVVYEQLTRDRRFEVSAPAEHPTAVDVLAGLYEKPYRIVHLAGHGQYEPPDTKGGRARSGLVLDNGAFLTAVEIGQMQQVPEMVFLNCCHLGQTGPDSSPVDYNRLAASISRELIEMGVRAVVAAGWAVDDAAAPKFAEDFYKAMLDGEPFGRALLIARQAVHKVFPHINTWGAYQAYGDPDYRLDPESIRTCTPSTDYVDAAELIEAVRAAGRRAADAGNTSAALSAAIKDIEVLMDQCPEEWRNRTDVLMELGHTLGNLHQFDAAVDYLRQALEVDGMTSTVTLQSVEQLANYEARLAADIAEMDPDGAQHFWRSATTRLENLIAVHETAERYALLASAYKRVAATETDPAKAAAALSQASNAYRQAHLRDVRLQRFDFYPVLNWLTLAFILDEPVPDDHELLNRCDQQVAERFDDDHSFFAAVAVADARLLRDLRDGRLAEQGKEAEDELNKMKALYRQVIDTTAPTSRELDSVYRNIDTVCSLLAKLSGERPGTATVISRLTELRRSISG